jgi:hypothetical protein
MAPLATTDDLGNFRNVPFTTLATPGNYTIQAHFVGVPGALLPSIFAGCPVHRTVN